MQGESRAPMFIDLHADTLSRIHGKGLEAGAFLGWPCRSRSGDPGPTLHVDLPGARKAGLDAQVMAIFVDGRGTPSAGLAAGREMAGVLAEIERRSGGAVRKARSARELLENRARGALSLILSLENAGDLILEHLDNLDLFRGLGARFAGLVWFARNRLGSGVGNGSDSDGLSPLGREAVRRLGKLGMALDLSHLNPAGFRDALAAAAGPVVASHSNARAVCDHPRNLTDDEIREIAARGGVVGLNLFPKFLRDPASGPATIDDAVRHLEHIAEVGGIGCIASGSDFDGCDRVAEGIDGVGDLPRISGALAARGWSAAEVNAWRGENAFRMLQMLGD